MNPRNRKINIITLGCSKNLVDSEVLMRQIAAAGLEITHNEQHSDARTVIINTCGFIHDAREESIDTILGYIAAKKEGALDHVYVMGCLSERYKEELQREMGEVDAFFGVRNLKEIVDNLGIDYRKELIGERILATPGHYAYMKISEGCDRSCAFCAIPDIRGKHVSKSLEVLLEEARYLADRRVRELILIAQDASYYGLDLYKNQKLPDLVHRLCEVNGLEWIRIHYTYPKNFPLDLLSLMASNEKVCKYLDLPLQHINDGVLTKMRRQTTKKGIMQLLEHARTLVPDVAIRTTMLVGHPGEGETEFQELLDFVEDFRFDRLGVFTYSHEEGTPGHARFKDRIPQDVKVHRADAIMTVQQAIAAELNHGKIGRTCKVLLDGEEGGYYVGRTEHDSPEVDQEVIIKKSREDMQTGRFYRVNITGASEFDLLGEPSSDPE